MYYFGVWKCSKGVFLVVGFWLIDLVGIFFEDFVLV